MSPTRSQLAKIHIAKKQLGLTDETYRDILALHFNVDSAAALDERQAARLLTLFWDMGWQPKSGQGNKKRGDYIKIKPGAAAAQQRKVLAMWNALGYSMDKLHARSKKQFQVDRFEWLTDGHALHVLISDLEKRLQAQKRR